MSYISSCYNGIAFEVQCHHFAHKWNLWYYREEDGKVWIDCNQRIASFCTVEDFWHVYDHTQRASLISFGEDYAVFKEHILPMWEDDRNENGGRWIVDIPKRHTFQFLDKLWLELLLLMTGGSFSKHSDEICGAVVNIRKSKDRISLWTSNSRNTVAVGAIGKIVKNAFKKICSETLRIKYVPHVHTIVQSQTSRKVDLDPLDPCNLD